MKKLTVNDKIKIYEFWKSGEKGISELSRLYSLNLSTVIYITRLADRHGIEVFNHEYTDYSPEFKKEAVKRVLVNGESKTSVAIDLRLTGTYQIRDWVNKVKEKGYTSLERMRGWQWYEKENDGGTRERKQGTSRKELETYNREFICKKIECLSFSKRKIKKEDIAEVITELRHELKCSLTFILDTIKANESLPQITRSDYYYQLSKTDKDLKNDDIMNRIISIFYEHKQRYGYRRITLQLKKEGFNINEKKVRRLMSRMGLKAKKRNKRRYSSYKGVKQSMSRKGNSIDDGLMENFFGLLKTEMYYDQENEYKTIEDLINAIEEYIFYYNNDRIKSRLKGLTPIEYRNQALIENV